MQELRINYKEARLKAIKMIKSAKREHYNIQFNNCVYQSSVIPVLALCV